MKVSRMLLPYAVGLVTKLLCIFPMFAAMKTSLPIFLLSASNMRSSWGLNNDAALCSSAAHFPFVALWANSAGTQPMGPVPVTRTLRAPKSYSFCNDIYIYIYMNTCEYEKQGYCHKTLTIALVLSRRAILELSILIQSDGLAWWAYVFGPTWWVKSNMFFMHFF